MQSAKSTLWGCAILVASLLAAACSTQHPIYNIAQSPIPALRDGSRPSMQDVNKAITEAAIYKRWRVENLDEDTVRASITVRARHHATIDIDYSQTGYSITLVKSEGLDQRGGRIHRNYNKWVHLLDQQIQSRLLTTGSGYTGGQQ